MKWALPTRKTGDGHYLYIDKDNEEFLDQFTVRQVLQKYYLFHAL